mmetsp:Transcript_2665/g.3700  ORF Transcript_2665/g.3700 Transcript_2665/m.3700 type:complete len:602 (-) Transcript_2665:105-1910(-)
MVIPVIWDEPNNALDGSPNSSLTSSDERRQIPTSVDVESLELGSFDAPATATTHDGTNTNSLMLGGSSRRLCVSGFSGGRFDDEDDGDSYNVRSALNPSNSPTGGSLDRRAVMMSQKGRRLSSPRTSCLENDVGLHRSNTLYLKATRQMIITQTSDRSLSKECESKNENCCSRFQRRFFQRSNSSGKIAGKRSSKRSDLKRFKFSQAPFEEASCLSKYHVKWLIDLLTRAHSFVSKKLSNFVCYLFETNNFQIFLMAYIGFFTSIISYAVLIFYLSESHFCMLSAEAAAHGRDYSNIRRFGVALSLSWTTFSTVGFGHVFPSQTNKAFECRILEFVLSMESFFGVLYASFCGAIIYARIRNLLEKANVLFSEAICIKYSQRSYPILELRIINERINRKGGEIFNGHVNCTVSRDMDVVGSKKKGMGDSKDGSLRFSQKADWKINEKATSPAQDDPSVFYNTEDCAPVELNITQPHYPYFKRTWWIRHELNEHSKLLKPEFRRLCKIHGVWPTHMLNPSQIRESMIDFDELTVTLTGTSASNGQQVYAKKIYSFAHLVVGFKFVHMVYKDEKSHLLKYNTDNLSVVEEEFKGSGEDLCPISE